MSDDDTTIPDLPLSHVLLTAVIGAAHELPALVAKLCKSLEQYRYCLGLLQEGEDAVDMPTVKLCWAVPEYLRDAPGDAEPVEDVLDLSQTTVTPDEWNALFKAHFLARLPILANEIRSAWVSIARVTSWSALWPLLGAHRRHCSTCGNTEVL